MARLIPAKPRAASDREMALIELLERGLDDTFVLFQPGEGRPFYLLLHPQGEALILLTQTAGEFRFDPDAETLHSAQGDEIDPADLLPQEASKVMEALPLDEGMGISGWVVVLSQRKEECGAARSTEAIRYYDDVESMSLLTDIREHVQTGIPEDQWFNINKTIQALSPGATDYKPGEITPAQKRWRESYRLQHFSPDSLHAGSAGASRATVSVAEQGHEAVHSDDRDTLSFIRMTELCVRSVVKENPIFLCGMNLGPEDIANPRFILPALLIVAADTWAPVVHARKLKGGFHIRLRSNPRALLGLEVAQIHPSAPFLFFMPVTRTIRSMRDGDEFVFDSLIEAFSRWLLKRGLDPDVVDDLDLRLIESKTG